MTNYSRDIKLKIVYTNEAFITHVNSNIGYDMLKNEIMQICDLQRIDQCTMKWVDDEGDPCMLSCELELNEALWLYQQNEDSEIIIHVFPSVPAYPGALCKGEDIKMYRKGARRWKKFYHLLGHKFSAKRFNRNAECFYCHDRIWGLGQQGLRCGNCRLLLHKRCQHHVKHSCGDDVKEMQPKPKANYPTTVVTNGGADNLGAYVDSPPVADDAARSKKGRIGLDDFNLLCVVGRGSYAKVFQVEYIPTNKIYAMKVIKKEFITDSDDIEWVQTEKHVFECASNYPFLVGLHSCFQTVSRLIYVIEFVNGGDLMYHMQRKLRLPEDHARFYSAEIACALNYLHTRAIVYRDLKLDNVLMDHEGHLKLTDYGMCKEGIEGDVKATTFCGTPNYIAPEILRNESYGTSVDWWSLGVLLFEMLAGCSPWMQPGHQLPANENTEDYLFNLILTKPIRIPRSLSTRASNIVKGLLNKDPLSRLASYPNSNFQDFQSHIFYRDLNWNDLEERRIQPPFRPELSHERDLANFDPIFTDEEVTFTPEDSDKLSKIDQSEFEGFEYINPLLLTNEETV